MMSVIENAVKHFRSKLDGSLEKIHIEEWETDVYFTHSSTLKEEASILKLQQEGKTIEALVQSLIVKAKNADGTPMFKLADRAALMNEVDPKVIIKVAAAVNGADLDSLEDVEKN